MATDKQMDNWTSQLLKALFQLHGVMA